MSVFTIRLTGLCLFVPRYEIANRQTNNSMRALLVDGRGTYGGSHSHEPHLPTLVCRHEDLTFATGERPIDASFIETRHDGSVGDLMDVFYLDDQDLVREGAVEEHLTIRYDAAADFGCANNNDKDSFTWVAPLARISSGSERVKSACLTPTNVDPSVVARVALTQGTIRTFFLAMDGDKKVVNWSFRVPGGSSLGPHRQSIADIVDVQADVSSVRLVTRLLRSPSNRRVSAVFGRELSLPIGFKPGRNVTVWVRNMPWADITETSVPSV